MHTGNRPGRVWKDPVLLRRTSLSKHALGRYLIAVALVASGALWSGAVAAPTVAATAPPDVSPVKVAASRFLAGHTVYVRGTDGRVWWRTVESFGQPGYSTNWRPLPGPVASGPDAAQVSNSDVWLAARGTDGTLLVRHHNGPTFSPWQTLGGRLTTAPVLLHETATGKLWAFVRGGDGAVWYRVRSTTGSWSGWLSAGGRLTAAPDAIDSGGGVDIRLYARGTDGLTWTRQFTDGVWQGWEKVGLAVTSATATVRSDQNFQIQYYRGAGNRVYSLTDVAPIDLGGRVTSAPDASHSGEVVVARGTDNALWARIGGAPWSSLGGRIA